MFEEMRDVEFANWIVVCRCKGNRYGMLLWNPRTKEFKYVGSCHRNSLCAILTREKFLTRIMENEKLLEKAIIIEI